MLLALGRLDGVSTLLPDTSLFLYTYVRKEALVSSQIEGTQSSLSDLLLYENKSMPGVPFDDVIEVSSYVSAIEHGLKNIRNGTPVSLRLIKEIHKILLSKGRGSGKEPGTFRRSQNWIGGTRQEMRCSSQHLQTGSMSAWALWNFSFMTNLHVRRYL